jgi:fatty-acyl-CoA synthase
MEFNLALVNDAIAKAYPDRECIVWGEKRFTYADLADRTRRLANGLRDRGLGIHRERSELGGHESGQDQLALYLYNGNEYLEGMLGAFRARVAPFNVNYRYVADELRYLLNDAGARGIVYHGCFAPTLQEILGDLPQLEVLVQVDDGSGEALLDGAVDYEQLLATSSDEESLDDLSPDDLYILYTGGTTGMPKGVLWRQHDIFVGAMGGRPFGGGDVFTSYEEIVENAGRGGLKVIATPPLMHGAAQWSTFTCFTGGGTIVMPEETRHLDPVAVWRAIEAEKVLTMQVVGDAFARPLIEELENGDYDASSLFMLVNGGAPMNPALKERFLAQLPNAGVLDAVGSSETGAQMGHVSSKGQATTGHFTPGPGTVVVSEDLTQLLAPGHEGTGWLAQEGYVPLGYLGDAEKTARTFPVIDGVRYSVPGDRAVWREDGIIDLLGRDSVTINSGGEKIFAEEVEQAIAQHPDVADVVVCGRPSSRWGSEVVALVKVRPGAPVTEQDLLEEASRHVARYKLPKAMLFLDEVVRSPAGKADYRWAKETVLAQLGEA